MGAPLLDICSVSFLSDIHSFIVQVWIENIRTLKQLLNQFRTSCLEACGRLSCHARWWRSDGLSCPAATEPGHPGVPDSTRTRNEPPLMIPPCRTFRTGYSHVLTPLSHSVLSLKWTLWSCLVLQTLLRTPKSRDLPTWMRGVDPALLRVRQQVGFSPLEGTDRDQMFRLCLILSHWCDEDMLTG